MSAHDEGPAGGEAAAPDTATGGVRYPDVRVRLAGEDGNPAFLIGKVMRALERAGATAAEVEEFAGEASSGDQDHVLITIMRWVHAY